MDTDLILFLTPDGPRLYDVGDELRAPEVAEPQDEQSDEDERAAA